MNEDDDFDLPPLEEVEVSVRPKSLVESEPSVEPTPPVEPTPSVTVDDPLLSMIDSVDLDDDEEDSSQESDVIDLEDEENVELDNIVREDTSDDVSEVPETASDLSVDDARLEALLEKILDEDDDDDVVDQDLEPRRSDSVDQVEDLDSDDDTTSLNDILDLVSDDEELDGLPPEEPEGDDELAVVAPLARRTERTEPEESKVEPARTSRRDRSKAMIGSFVEKVKSEVGVDSDDTPRSKGASARPKKQPGKNKGRPSVNLDLRRLVPSPLMKVLNLVLTPFRKVHQLFVTILTKLLTLLGRLPVVGKLFTFLKDFPHLVNVASFVVPFALAFWLWLQFTKTTFVTTSKVELPDMGSASSKVVSTDQSKRQAVVQVTNTGDVIAEVRPSLVVASSDWWNPSTWYAVKTKQICRGPVVQVPIESSRKVTIKCSKPFPSTNVKVGSRLSTE